VVHPVLARTNASRSYRCKRSRLVDFKAKRRADKYTSRSWSVPRTSWITRSRQLRHHVVQLQSGRVRQRRHAPPGPQHHDRRNDATSSVDIRFDLNAEERAHPPHETFVTLSASSFRIRQLASARVRGDRDQRDLHHHRLGDIVFRHRQLYRDREWSGLRDHHTNRATHGGGLQIRGRRRPDGGRNRSLDRGLQRGHHLSIRMDDYCSRCSRGLASEVTSSAQQCDRECHDPQPTLASPRSRLRHAPASHWATCVLHARRRGTAARGRVTPIEHMQEDGSRAASSHPSCAAGSAGTRP